MPDISIVSVTRVDPGSSYTIPSGTDFLVYLQTARYDSDSTGTPSAVTVGGEDMTRAIDHNGGDDKRLSSAWVMPETDFPAGAGPHTVSVTHPDIFGNDPVGHMYALADVHQTNWLVDVAAGGETNSDGDGELNMGSGLGVGTVVNPLSSPDLSTLDVLDGGIAITPMFRRFVGDRNVAPFPVDYTLQVDQLTVDSAMHFVAHRLETADANDVAVNWNFDTGFNSNSSAVWISLRPAPDVVMEVTDVDTDETVEAGQTGATFTGTDLGATTSDRTVTIEQGAVAVTQTQQSGDDTGGTFDVVLETAAEDIKFGSATFRVVRTSNSEEDTIGITVNPASGELFVDLTSVHSPSSERISSTPDLEVGDQIHARGVGGGATPTGLVLNADGTFYFQSGSSPQNFEARVWATTSAHWGAWAEQTVAEDVSQSVTSVIEALQGFTATEFGVIEALQGVAQDAVVNFEALGVETSPVNNDALIPIEAKGTVKSTEFPHGWNRVCKITVDSTKVLSSTIYSFLLTEDNLPTEMFDADGPFSAQNGGGDIRIAGGESQGRFDLRPIEVELFEADNDPANGRAKIWVNGSLNSTVDVDFWVWYNTDTHTVQPAPDAQFGSNLVWSEYYAVWHLGNKSPVDSAASSSLGGKRQLVFGSAVGQRADWLGNPNGALDLDGSVNSYAYAKDTPPDGFVDSGVKVYDVMAWVFADTLSSADFANHIGSKEGELAVSLDAGGQAGSGTHALRVDTFGSDNLAVAPENISIGEWKLVRGGWHVNSTEGSIRAKIDGEALVSQDTTDTSPNGDAPFVIGGRLDSSFLSLDVDAHFDGAIAEVRIKDGQPSNAQLNTEWNNLSDPASFATAQSPESTPGNKWVIEALQSLNRNVAPEIEAKGKSFSDAVMTIEARGRITQAAVLRVESILSVLKTSSSNTEALQSVLQEVLVAAESPSATSSSLASLLEALESVSREVALDIESLGNAAGQLDVQLEALGIVDAARSPMLEALQSVDADSQIVFEAWGEFPVSQTLFASFEARGRIPVALSAPLEALQQTVRERTAYVEALAGVLASGSVGYESPGLVVADPQLPLEAVSSTSAERQQHLEAISTVSPASVQLEIESLGNVAVAAVLPLEAKGRVADSAELLIEGAATVSAQTVHELEALAPAIKSVLLPQEALFRLAAMAGVPYEALLNPDVVAVLNLVEREVFFQVRLGREVAFTEILDREVVFTQILDRDVDF